RPPADRRRSARRAESERGGPDDYGKAVFSPLASGLTTNPVDRSKRHAGFLRARRREISPERRAQEPRVCTMPRGKAAGRGKREPALRGSRALAARVLGESESQPTLTAETARIVRHGRHVLADRCSGGLDDSHGAGGQGLSEA